MYVLYDRKVGEKRGDWRKGKKNKMTLLFHETCRINADLGLVPVPEGFAWGRGLEGFMSRARGHWDRSSGGVRACQITYYLFLVLHANPCIPVGRLADPLSPYHCTVHMYLRGSWVIDSIFSFLRL